MLVCPTSSPKITRMFGFFAACAKAGSEVNEASASVAKNCFLFIPPPLLFDSNRSIFARACAVIAIDHIRPSPSSLRLQFVFSMSGSFQVLPKSDLVGA